MSVVFTGGANIKTTSAPLITGYPCTVGFHFSVNSTLGAFASAQAWSVGQDNVARNSFNMGIADNTGTHVCMNADNGTAFENTLGTTILGGGQLGAFYYVVGRWISATNRRLSIFDSFGNIEHAQGTTNVTISNAFTAETMGVRADQTVQNFDGQIAKLWTANADIQPDGGQLDNALLVQLARYGPLSVPSIVPNIIQYFSFRESSLDGNFGEVYYGSATRIWTPTGTQQAYLQPIPENDPAARVGADTKRHRRARVIGSQQASAAFAFRRSLSPIGSRTGSRQVHRV